MEKPKVVIDYNSGMVVCGPQGCLLDRPLQHKEKTKKILPKVLLLFDWYLLFEFIFTSQKKAAAFPGWNFKCNL
jgi:hypothetical protein